MRRLPIAALSLLFALATGLFHSTVDASSPTLQVNESLTRVFFKDGTVEVALVVQNLSGRRSPARINLQLQEPVGDVRAGARIERDIEPGDATITCHLDFYFAPPTDQDEVLWWRLRYSIASTNAGPEARESASGIISVSEISSDFFALALVSPPVAASGHYRARVRATQAVTALPMAGVNIEARITPESDTENKVLAVNSTTDKDGYAVIELDLSPDQRSDNAKLQLVGSRNGLSQKIDLDLLCDSAPRITVTSDKLIYQPGQTLHIRALVQDANMRALPATALKLRIEDQEETLVYRVETTTTRFGIAAADWVIPNNARLGDYEVIARVGESGEHSDYQYRHKVKVSRYELPTFTVSVKADRGYYLEGQKAEVEIRADYLFGQPLTVGHVRVVRETSREWNYREQKWDIDESAAYEGELDSIGKFVARVDPDKEYREFAERNYQNFEDLEFAAYVTDANTGRTEQRRFDLRLSKEPIHVYVVDDNSSSSGSGSDFYVSTYYADGQPAQCRVTVSEASSPDQTLQTVETNKYGLARVTRLVGGSPGRQVNLVLIARDSRQNTGHQTHTIWGRQRSSLRLTTSKSIYRDGEAVEAEIESDPPAASVFVEVLRGWVPLRSLELKLTNGKGRFELPYTKEFRDAVTLMTYRLDGAEQFDTAQRTVLYPHDHELQLKVLANQTEYKPGENGTIEFTVRRADGRPAESSLGVSLIDKAVDELIRTDSDFGAMGSFRDAYDRVWDRGESIGSITRASLDKIDTSRPIPPDLDMVAAVLLLRDGYWLELKEASYSHRLTTLFSVPLERQFRPIREALKSRYLRNGQYPRTSGALTREMKEFGIEFDQMRDPWGTRYYTEFSFDAKYDALKIVSSGPDKRLHTPDDFVVCDERWPYFKPFGDKIDQAAIQYHKRTGRYIRDVGVLKHELRRLGVDFDSLRDHWGQPCRVQFLARQTRYIIEVIGGGENRFEGAKAERRDDFNIWSSSIDYSTELQSILAAAVGAYFQEMQKLPQSDQELSDAIRRYGKDDEMLRDPWGQRYYAVFTVDHRYADKVRLYSEAHFGQPQQNKTEITPVTQELRFVNLRSAGPDGMVGTADDFEVARVSRVVAETDAQGVTTKPLSISPPSTGATGEIRGVVTDIAGAVVARATVHLGDQSGNIDRTVVTGTDGTYSLLNLHPGIYEMRFDAPGFKTTMYVDVPVQALNITEVDAILNTGGATETVTVTAGASQIQTQRSESASEVSGLPVNGRNLPVTARTGLSSQAISTPRLREYFPETLLWQPSLETDTNGHARISFKLADNITTWRLSAIASTEDGEVGTVESTILAFQPFFVEHDPPRVLTQGDQIALPVVVRNYLEKPQSVALEINPAPWFRLTGPGQKQLEVKVGSSAREVFEFQVIRAIQNGKQRVTAFASEMADAIEKSVTVHPDGEEIVRTTTRVIDDDAVIEAAIPPNAIDGTVAAELKIYPNLMVHVLEGVEGIMQRPYGCAEQTISSAYPSLLLLRRRKASDVAPDLLAKAERYVRSAYERLVNDRDEEGGFSYWGRGRGDPALTAYALKFLTDASEVVPIDESAIEAAEGWLIKQQRVDGSWAAFDWRNQEDRGRTAFLTAYIARVLGERSGKETANNNGTRRYPSAKVLERALAYLSSRVAEIDEPYLIASYVLAATSAGNRPAARGAAVRLRNLAREENGTSYWALETNTPFYAWGLAGRVETTALVLQALADDDADRKVSVLDDGLVNRGLAFLLSNKDRYGVWYSTQATINVLDTLMTLVDKTTSSDVADGQAQILINGRPGPSIAMPARGKLVGPLTADLSGFVSRGINRVEIRRPAGSPRATAQVVTNQWEPWSSASRPSGPAALRFAVSFDKTSPEIGDEVTCTVKVERVGFAGYGMLLAEIGLPPGADVDRASLERVMKLSDAALQQYDVLPDRLIVYLWPRAGGARFEFKFKTRFGMTAQTAASVLYDYYNPEARVVVPPVRFTVK